MQFFRDAFPPWPSGRLNRVLRRWWSRLSPSRQDRLATLAPLSSVLLFLAAITVAFWYLRNEETTRAAELLRRDTEVAQQQIRLHLVDNQEQLLRIAREVATRAITPDQFVNQAASFLQARPDVRSLAWRNAHGELKAAQALQSAAGLDDSNDAAPGSPASGVAAPLPLAAEAAFDAARNSRQPAYSRPFKDPDGLWLFQVQVPIIDRGAFAGVLVAEYGLDALLRSVVPAEVTGRHPVSILGSDFSPLVSTVTTLPGQREAPPSMSIDLPLTPAANGLVLRGQGYRTSAGLVGNTLFWMVVALSALTVWTLLATWRHMRRRAQIQNALINETNFRRAMENSMLTGMRATDMHGRVTYVNPAFCAMTGYAESDLLDMLPPFPYWPSDRVDEHMRIFQQELQGRSPAGGIEVKVQRKDGSNFDARLYVSPLIDPRGQQTGWMTSMTNITEAKRIRDQLSASHERFTTVLEGLDAAVSVLSVQQGELLFANRSYRLWFGADARGHDLLANGEAGYTEMPEDDVDAMSGLPTQELTDIGTPPREVYVESLQMWFDVRTRYLQWTDGRLAQMLIATDITARRRIEEQAQQQAERAQVTSRLVTMGEMASSVAHELNQPLTAITNYCNGIVSRVRNNAITTEELVAALQKTARQAERAGQVIHRIRAFVKKSEPQRQLAKAQDIVEDAVELAGIELRRRKVSIHTYVAQRLPLLRVDPILIEQVLMNLLKNAAEAIDTADMPTERRHIELQVVPRQSTEEGHVIEFSVTDAGPGMREDVISRLFEAFFSTKAEGLGIGLSLCRSIIESHQGRMRAENLYNGSTVTGCRFAFTLPVDQTPPAERLPASRVSSAVSASNPHAAAP